MVNTRKTTDIWLFNNSFGKDPSLNYINAYHPTEDDAAYHMSSASYQRLNAPIRYRLTPTDSFNDIVNCPYLMFKNANERVYYAFVSECKYVNDAVAEISFKIDPFTTYLDNGINDEMLVERQTGSFSNPDPELSFNANQFMREIDVLDKNSQVIDNDNEMGSDGYLLHDCMLIYVRNNYETTDGMTSINGIDTGGLDNLPSLKRFITYYKDGTTEFNEGRVESYLAELQDRADDGDAIINPHNSSGQIDGVDEGGGKFNGNHTGYDVYVITDLTDTDNVFNDIIDNPKFYGSNGTNIIGAEYRKLLRKTEDFTFVSYGSNGCYKIGLAGRKEMSQPYHLDIGDFDFPDNIPKELQQSPYFKRLFVSNNGNTTISFNPNASPTKIDSNDSNLTSIEVIDSAEMGAPIVYNFNSTDSNNQKQYYVDTTDRTIPVFADPRIIEYLKDLQMINAETKLDVEKLAKRIKSIEDKFTYHINMNQQNYDPLNSDRLKYNQKIDRDNLGRQQTNSRNNLTDTNDTAVANLAKSNSTRLTNLERTISTSQANLNRTQGADKESLTNQQATDNSNLDTTYDAKSKNITNNYDHNLFVAQNQIALNSLNMNNNNNLDYFRLENERNHARADLRAEKEYNGLVTQRKVYQNYNNARIEARLEDEDMLVNQYTNTKALSLSGGVGDIAGNLPEIAKGFEQFVSGIVLGAVGLTAALAALDIKQRAARINFAHKWNVSGKASDNKYIMDTNPSDWIFPAGKYLPDSDQLDDTVNADHKGLVGISTTFISRNSKKTPDEVADEYGDTVRDFGLYWVRTAMQNAHITANYKDNYETYQPTKINNAKSYGDNVVDLEVQNRQANFDSSSQYTKDNLSDELSRDNNNLSNNRAADTSNLSRTHGSQNFALNTKQDAAYNNLNASNTTSRNNLKAENSTSEANLDKSNKTAMGNLLRDIKRENDNLKATQDSQTNSLRVDWILGNNGIVLNTALEIVDEYTNFYNDYITRVVNFANRINSAGLRGSITVTSANYWSQVFSKLNMFKVYDISINARELRYCTNYIKRYGSYCGLVKYGISFDPNTYIRTKDYHMEPVMMPSWAADEISEHLNTGVYIRLRV